MSISTPLSRPISEDSDDDVEEEQELNQNIESRQNVRVPWSAWGELQDAAVAARPVAAPVVPTLLVPGAALKRPKVPSRNSSSKQREQERARRQRVQAPAGDGKDEAVSDDDEEEEEEIQDAAEEAEPSSSSAKTTAKADRISAPASRRGSIVMQGSIVSTSDRSIYSKFEDARLPTSPNPDGYWIFLIFDVFTPTPPLVEQFFHRNWQALLRDQYPVEALRVFHRSAIKTFPKKGDESREYDNVFEVWHGGRFVAAGDEDAFVYIKSYMMPSSPRAFINFYAEDERMMKEQLAFNVIANGSHPFLVEIFFTRFVQLPALCKALSEALILHGVMASVVFVDFTTAPGSADNRELATTESWMSMLPAVKILKFDKDSNSYEVVARLFGNEYAAMSMAISDERTAKVTKSLVVKSKLPDTPITLFETQEVEVSNRISLVRSLFTLDSTKLICNFDKASELGSGGFGVVYRGTFYGLPVAIKMLRKRDNSPAKTADLFNEAHHMMQMRHPNFVQVIGMAAKPDGFCIVQELCDESLNNFYTTKQNLPWVRQLSTELFRGLAYLHGRGQVHLDLKPDNLLYSARGAITKIGDLGLVKLMDTNAARVAVSIPGRGTISWMGPEHLAAHFSRDLSPQLTSKVDIFAIGLILYAFLSGRHLRQEIHAKSAEELKAWLAYFKVDDEFLKHVKTASVDNDDNTKTAQQKKEAVEKKKMEKALLATLIMRRSHLTKFYIEPTRMMPADKMILKGKTLQAMPPIIDPPDEALFYRNIIEPCLRPAPNDRPSAERLLVALDEFPAELAKQSAAAV